MAQLSENMEKILESVEDKEKSRKMRELLNAIGSIRTYDKIMLIIAPVLNIAIAVITVITDANLTALFPLHFALLLLCLDINHREIRKCVEQLNSLGFPFEKLEGGL